MERSDASSVSTASSSVDFAAHNVWDPNDGATRFTCRLAASSNSLWKKSTWRESRFLVILLFIYNVKRRGLTIPLDALPISFSLGQRLLHEGTIAFSTFMLLFLYCLFNVFLRADTSAQHEKERTNDLWPRGSIATRRSQTRQSRPSSVAMGTATFLANDDFATCVEVPHGPSPGLPTDTIVQYWPCPS